ncbi:MAG: serine hydrolase [Planctomycetaceae bacterium]
MNRSIPRSCVSLLVLSGAAAGFAAEQPKAVYPGTTWATAEPADVGLDATLLRKARKYALSGGGSGMIIRRGRVVMVWGDLKKRYDLKSTTKSIGITSVGLAIKDGKLKLGDRARKHHPTFGVPPQTNRKTGWLDDMTLFHLATQTAGFEKPGGYRRVTFRPGTKWSYSDGGPNWLAECVTLVYRKDVRDLMFARVFKPLGISPPDLTWRRNAYRPAKINGVARREFGSGVHANVNAMARIGYLYLRNGRWKETQILPEEFVARVRRPAKTVVGLPEVDAKRFGNASDHYGLLWWNNADGTLKNVPRDAYWSWGLYDSLIVVIPSLDIVVARAGKSWKRNWSGHYDVLQPFLGPIANAAKSRRQTSLRSGGSGAPYPPSKRIQGIRWAPASKIIRLAKGSDNWPITWSDDGHLYTAYGDGRGFRPLVPRKLSLGLAVISGDPPKIAGVNIRSKTAERIGQGARGEKASGLLMVGGTLYMWVRNANNSQLAWSKDRGKTWARADWKFTTGFGAPTFLNFGRNYAGARDGFVYIYSHDSDSAYKPADRMLLARVPKDKLAQRVAYEFFRKLGANGKPVWTREIKHRGAVFHHPGNCYRSGITYNAGLKRYLWCQTIPKGDTRFAGGFGIYDAREPWGPWTTVFFTRKWDVGPGETSSFPTKWMSRDGQTVHLVFSGNDYFSVRKAKFAVRDSTGR